jgi:hypothetical protein
VVAEGALAGEQEAVVVAALAEGQVELAAVPEPEEVVAAELELASVRPQGLAWAWVREPRSALGLMHRWGLARMLLLDLEPMLRALLVRIPSQVPAAPLVMGPVMGPATEQGTRGSVPRTAPDLELQNSALRLLSLSLETGVDSVMGVYPIFMSVIIVHR